MPVSTGSAAESGSFGFFSTGFFSIGFLSPGFFFAIGGGLASGFGGSTGASTTAGFSTTGGGAGGTGGGVGCTVAAGTATGWGAAAGAGVAGLWSSPLTTLNATPPPTIARAAATAMIGHFLLFGGAATRRLAAP